MPYGLLSTGFVPKTLEVIREEINDSLHTAYGPSLDTTDGSALGQFVGIMAEKYAELWELAETVNTSQDPDGATQTSLDALSALTGTTRDAASPSTVTLTLTGIPTTIVTIDSRVSVEITEDEFKTLAAATITILTAWVAATPYTVGTRRTNAGRAYVVITAGTSAGSGGPTTTSSDITDGTVHWRYIGEGTGAVDVAAEAVETGPTVAVSGSINEIETPIAGWQSVINLLDADLGSDIETDEHLRVKRELELSRAGSSPIDAIRAELLDVSGVTNVTVFENDTDVTDVDGIPPHAVEALVQGGDDQDIFDRLLASVAGGIATYGNTTGTATDDAGIDHTVKFTRPTEKLVYVTITIIKDPSAYPLDGDAQVEAAIVAFGDAQATGKNVVSSSVGAQAFSVTGVLDVTSTLISVFPITVPVSSVTIPIAIRELALFDTSRITVIASDGVP